MKTGDFIGQRFVGVVVGCMIDRGYCFLSMPQGQDDLFLHLRDCDRQRLPALGDRVSVEVTRCEKTGKLRGARAVIET